MTHKLEFYKHFLGVAKRNMKKSRSVIVTGDVNTAYAEIDIARAKENAKVSGFMLEEREALGEFFKAGFVDTFRTLHPEEVKYSWCNQVTRARDRNIGWRLDYFFVSPDLKERVVSADIHTEVIGSDHCPTSLTLDI